MNAVEAYKKYCERKKVTDVFTRIHEEVEDGMLSYVGFLPPGVIDYLEMQGYYVYELSTHAQSKYIIRWGS